MTANTKPFQHAMNQGHSAAWDQRWDRAAGYYRQALEIEPENPAALTNLGLALVELQQFDNALECYLKAARLTPDDPLPLEKVAQLSERMGNLNLASRAALRAAEGYLKNHDAAKAVENWERVTRLDPDNVQAYVRLATVLERLGDKEKAVGAYLAAASLLQTGGAPEKAAKAVQQAFTLLPDNGEVLRAISLLKDFKPLPPPPRPRGATAPLRMSQVRGLQAAAETPANPDDLNPIAAATQKALTVLAGMLFDTAEEVSEAPSAGRGLQAIVSGTAGLSPRPVDHTRMIMHLSQVVDLQTRGEYAQAAGELQEAVAAGLDHAAASYDLGFLHAQTGRIESAARHLQTAIRHPDFVFGAHLLLAGLLQRKEQLKEAALEYLEALKHADAQSVDPEQADDLMQLYDLLIESQRFQNDSAALGRICKNIHDLLDRADWLSQIQKARRQLPGVEQGAPPIPVAEVIVEAHSSDVIHAVSGIFEMMRRGQLRSATEAAFFALEEAPTYLPLHALMAEIQAQNGNLSTAIEKFQVIARTYAMRGDAHQAINYARRVVELAPGDINIRLSLIQQLTSFGKVEAAIDETIQLAEVYYTQADLAQARKTYTDALRIAQGNNAERSLRVKLLHRMADIDMQSLDWRQALRVLEQVRTLQPDDVEARSRIIALSLRLRQEQQALDELDNFSAYLHANNQQPQLLKFLEGLAAEYPERIPLRRRLSDAYVQAGRKSDAIYQLDAIGEICLQANDRPAAIQTIETIIALEPPNRGEYELLLEQLRRG